MMKYSAFSIIIAGFLTPLPLVAVEFNINAIDKDQRGNVDLSQFKDKNHVAPGHYFVTVSINNTPLTNGWQLAWYKKDDTTEVCIPSDLADTFGLDDKYRSMLTVNAGCVDFSPLPQVRFEFIQATQTLEVTLP